MTASLRRKACLPFVIPCLTLALPGGASAECLTDAWDLFAATGDVAAIETQGNVAWVAAQGGVIRIDLTNVSGGDPAQIKITDAEGLVSTEVTCLTIDGFGNVYVGTRTDGVSVFDSDGNHLTDLFAFDDLLWSDLVIAMDAVGDVSGGYDRVVVTSVDGFTPQGTLEGGGFMILRVTRGGDGTFTWSRETFVTLELAREVFAETGEIWFGTSGSGLWLRDENADPPTLNQVFGETGVGLLSTNVKEILRAPAPDLSGDEVLWIGTGAGLQTYDGAVLDTVTAFTGRNILDLHRAGTDLYVLAEEEPTPGQLVQDLYRIDLSVAFDTLRIARSDCLADTLYVPRRVAVDASGRVVLGTREDAFTVREGGSWFCPPPLGPHSRTIADLVLAPDGTLYFGTGDKNRVARANGLGIFDGVQWLSLTPGENPDVLHANTTEVVVWPDTTIWFGTTLDRNNGGLNRFIPKTGSLQKYHDDVVDLSRRTLGRNIWALELDGDSNLWIAYGQEGGGLSVIEFPSLLITDFPFEQIFSGTSLLRDIAIDSRGRVWASTFSDANRPGQLYIVDHRGTISNRSDDDYSSFNVANEIFDIGPVPFLTIDSSDQIWLAGEKGLVVGQIGGDAGGRPSVAWQLVEGTASQLGGRNPLPYTTGELDWDENLWLGTETSGLVRISPDLGTWTWFDQLEGCPLPDPAVTGLYIDNLSRKIYVGTAAGGIAIIDLSGVGGVETSELDPRPFPNPWHPGQGGIVSFSGIPADETTTVRIFTVSGDLVFEDPGVRGAKIWEGRNLGGQVVESGVYVVTAVSTNGRIYEGKVAVIR